MDSILQKWEEKAPIDRMGLCQVVGEGRDPKCVLMCPGCDEVKTLRGDGDGN